MFDGEFIIPSYEGAPDFTITQMNVKEQELARDTVGTLTMLPDGLDRPANADLRFGSAHATGCQFVFADGHVKFISYNIDPYIHWLLGNRQDKQAVDNSQIED